MFPKAPNGWGQQAVPPAPSWRVRLITPAWHWGLRVHCASPIERADGVSPAAAGDGRRFRQDCVVWCLRLLVSYAIGVIFNTHI